jgi:hypothetical protein
MNYQPGAEDNSSADERQGKTSGIASIHFDNSYQSKAISSAKAK